MSGHRSVRGRNSAQRADPGDSRPGGSSTPTAAHESCARPFSGRVRLRGHAVPAGVTGCAGVLDARSTFRLRTVSMRAWKIHTMGGKNQ